MLRILEFVLFLQSRLIFNVFSCFYMFGNHLCKQTFFISKVRVSQKVKGAVMRNLRDTVFYIKTNCKIFIGVPLRLFVIYCFRYLLKLKERNILDDASLYVLINMLYKYSTIYFPERYYFHLLTGNQLIVY